MFGPDFFPTPRAVAEQMIEGLQIENKVILEPSAGRGDLVEFLQEMGAREVIACENDRELSKILATKCRIVEPDFLSLKAEQVSHIDLIIMNPPFSQDEKHILHAWKIAPAGCQIVALANLQTVKNACYQSRLELKAHIEAYGSYIDLGPAFARADRKTGVDIALIRLHKPGQNYAQEFEGFFLDEDPEEGQGNGIMPYNAIRDLVNRYVEAVKMYDQQLETAVRLNGLTSLFHGESLGFTITEGGKPKARNDYKKGLQKSAWSYIFRLMKLEKVSTRGLREDINKFVETQTQVPFTMRNIYKMLEIVIGTTESRMNRALEEVFDEITSHADENKFRHEGWKTNSFYMLNKKFILGHIVETSWRGYPSVRYGWRNSELIEDMQKALCFLTGMDYTTCTTLHNFFSGTAMAFGQWYSWGFFEVRAYKKGTMHFKFQNEDLWAKFNQRIAKIKGFPLFEAKPRPEPKARPQARPTDQPLAYPEILFTVKVA
jgi:hypothetical protein